MINQTANAETLTDPFTQSIELVELEINALAEKLIGATKTENSSFIQDVANEFYGTYSIGPTLRLETAVLRAIGTQPEEEWPILLKKMQPIFDIYKDTTVKENFYEAPDVKPTPSSPSSLPVHQDSFLNRQNPLNDSHVDALFALHFGPQPTVFNCLRFMSFDHPEVLARYPYGFRVQNLIFLPQASIVDATTITDLKRQIQGKLQSEKIHRISISTALSLCDELKLSTKDFFETLGKMPNIAPLQNAIERVVWPLHAPRNSIQAPIDGACNLLELFDVVNTELFARKDSYTHPNVWKAICYQWMCLEFVHHVRPEGYLHQTFKWDAQKVIDVSLGVAKKWAHALTEFSEVNAGEQTQIQRLMRLCKQTRDSLGQWSGHQLGPSLCGTVPFLRLSGWTYKNTVMARNTWVSAFSTESLHQIEWLLGSARVEDELHYHYTKRIKPSALYRTVKSEWEINLPLLTDFLSFSKKMRETSTQRAHLNGTSPVSELFNHTVMNPITTVRTNSHNIPLTEGIKHVFELYQMSPEKAALNSKRIYLDCNLFNDTKTAASVNRYAFDPEKEYHAQMNVATPSASTFVHEWSHLLDMVAVRTLPTKHPLRQLITQTIVAFTEFPHAPSLRNKWIKGALHLPFSFNKTTTDFMEQNPDYLLEDKAYSLSPMDFIAQTHWHPPKYPLAPVQELLLPVMLRQLYNTANPSKDWLYAHALNIKQILKWKRLPHHKKYHIEQWVEENTDALKYELTLPVGTASSLSRSLWLNAPFYWTSQIEIFARAAEQAARSMKKIQEPTNPDLTLWQQELIERYRAIGTYIQTHDMPWEDKETLKLARNQRREKMIRRQVVNGSGKLFKP